MRVRTRFAPSPTGYLHIGGLRTALYAYLFAKKNGGDFILRIEDTDRERLVDEASEIIYRTLKDTGLIYDEGPDVGGAYGPYIQSERKEIYQKYAEELVERGAAYYCFCTKERLAEARAKSEAEGEQYKYDKHCLALTPEEIKQNIEAGVPYVIRQNIPKEGETTYSDMVYGTVSVPNSDMEDNVLLKSDGYPTYNLANVVDD
ncbi:MAG: glutamate--tRNA ligase family protein, partial [Christensenella sp.]